MIFHVCVATAVGPMGIPLLVAGTTRNARPLVCISPVKVSRSRNGWSSGRYTTALSNGVPSSSNLRSSIDRRRATLLIRPTERLDRERKLSLMSSIDSWNRRRVLAFCWDFGRQVIVVLVFKGCLTPYPESDLLRSVLFFPRRSCFLPIRSAHFLTGQRQETTEKQPGHRGLTPLRKT